MFFFFPIGGGGGGFLVFLIMFFLMARVFRTFFRSDEDERQRRNQNNGQRRYYYYRFDSDNQQQYENRTGYRQYDTVSDPYSVLGLAANASESDIKKRYRKLIMENHPDTLASRGADEKTKEAAVKRFRCVQEAYEQICRERGIK